MGKPGKIVFSKDGDIYTMNPDGSDETNLTEDESGDDFYEMGPAWSPDGKRIAFVSDRGGDHDLNIYVTNSDGTGVSQLTESQGVAEEPRWSPDGEKILFGSNRGGSGIYLMNPDGTAVERVLEAPQELSGVDTLRRRLRHQDIRDERGRQQFDRYPRRAGDGHEPRLATRGPPALPITSLTQQNSHDRSRKQTSRGGTRVDRRERGHRPPSHGRGVREAGGPR